MKKSLLVKLLVLSVLAVCLLSCWNGVDTDDSDDGSLKVTYDGNG